MSTGYIAEEEAQEVADSNARVDTMLDTLGVEVLDSYEAYLKYVKDTTHSEITKLRTNKENRL